MLTKKLNNGLHIPKIGFGTWQITENVDLIIHTALQAGYRHIDTAVLYGNETEIGHAIKNAGINREEIFLTTKVWNTHRGYENVLQSFEESLNKLQTDYIDLYLLHWPEKTSTENWDEINASSWRALEELYLQGKVKAIGVSNFMLIHLDSLLKKCSIKPMVNQIEYHPGYLQDEVITYCKDRNIAIAAWSPIGSGRLLQHPLLKDLAQKYHISVAQLCIQFALQNDIIVLPKSTNKENIINNINLPKFTIDEHDMALIKNMEEAGFSGLHPDKVDF
ncbi:MAG TPA: aldo/keto reductase [Flavobacterium sp.]|nr:aldo/keto reductase [Flavobacterium sp.]